MELCTFKEYYRSQALSSKWDISFNLCSEGQLSVCQGKGKYACQTNYDSNWVFVDVYDLGSLNKTNFMDDGVTLTYRGYISPDSPRGWCIEGSYEVNYRITNFNLLCDKGVENVDVLNATEPIGCYYNVTLKSKQFCECPLQCSPPHGKCVNGECVCDQFSNGTSCEKLIITIDSVVNTTINGGIGYIHFSNFSMTFPLFQLKIGDLYCTNVMLLNSSTLQFTISPGIGIHNVEIINGNSSYLSYDSFGYQCNSDCSPPHGECNLTLGSCSCDTQTNGTNCENLIITIDSVINTTISGGIGYIHFSNFTVTFPLFQLKIGGVYCTNVKLLNSSTLQFSIGPGNGIHNVEIINGNSSYLSYDSFGYQCNTACSPPHGECNLTLGSCSCDTQTNGTNCENSKLFLNNIIPTDENGGTTYLYGYFGNTTSNLSIMIGDNDCTNIEQLNETLIKCDVGKGSGFKDVILKDRDLIVHVLNLFQYFKPITTNPPKHCIDNCGAPNNGICTSTGCMCISPWIGNDCKSKIISIPQPSLNYSNPVTDIQLIDNKVDTKLFRSLVSIVKLRELDFQSKQVNSFTFIEWEYYKINESTSQYKSNITNLGLTTFITVTLQWFENETNVVFVNQNIKMNPSSIKYTIEISEYKFSSNLNQLQLVMMASLSINKTNDICSNKEFSETSSGDDSNYLKIQIDDHSLYGRFIKRALIDSIPRSIDNVPLDSSMNQVDSASLSQSYIGISVPFFKKQIIIDPDFSVLLSSSSDSFKSESSICSFNKESKFSGGLISAIVLCSFFVFASLITMVAYSYYKKRYDRNIMKEIRTKLSKR
ncbi:hypothetical protein DDB_G0290285 [Dictyostelium discoideum AX4]|uniref:MRH domain-containing protein n=1 Tax=Dictyostelium discoideum TaxID=44689 RepID=Q54GB8_DICDI|nr:hypothetical protein DDB_G0290285 [Dictyostelium discoideum AX4]EAL62269.1 hypothetical protein DDB_G0290285 [Dictyostelium discoideum AX4]|eukprot:XP_635765.1 hypothetical protein DDB_G0290285 [Dictyostelium discoideum AX4]